MTPEQLTAELSQTPVPDVATMLTRYVREACALDPVSAASTLMAAISIARTNIRIGDPPKYFSAIVLDLGSGSKRPDIGPTHRD